MAHTNPCPQCAQTGLPILFTRYAAYFSAVPREMAEMATLQPTGSLQARPSGVAVKAAMYQLRMLQSGYLYIRTEADCIRLPEWQAYVVHPHGYLTKIDVTAPIWTRAEPSCRPDVWGANRSLVWIQDAKLITSLHYMLHPDPIDHKHLREVIDKDPDRYMQSFDVASWADGNTKQKDTCQPGLLNGQVVEFRALNNEPVRKAMEEQFFGLMGINAQERGWNEIEPDSPEGPALYPTFQGHTYDHAHGKRLKGMAEYLQTQKGAVVACEDPIGITQALAMHHMLAAMPYELWMQSAPDLTLPEFAKSAREFATIGKDFPKITNGWLAAASTSIEQLLGAIKNGVIASGRSELEEMKRRRDAKARGDDPSPGRYDRSGGKVRFLTPKEALAEDIRALDARIAALEAAEALDTITREGKVQITLAEARSLVRQPLIDAFDAVHKKQLDLHDARLCAISADTIAWLDSKSHLSALERYNGKEAASGGDGERFALQLGQALVDLNTSSRGRAYLGAKDPFAFSRDNLTARLISCNNPKISQELRNACNQLNGSATSQYDMYPGNGYEILIKHAEALAKVMGGFKEIGASTEKMNALFGKRSSMGWNDGVQGAADFSHAARMAHATGFVGTPIFTAVSLFAIRLPATQREAMLLTAKGLALTNALGAKAVEKLKLEAAQLARAKAQAQSTTQRINVSEWLIREREIQTQLEDHVKIAAKGQGVIGTHRLRMLMLAAECLSVLAGGSAKAMRMDLRNAFEASSQVLSAIGSMRDIRTMLFEEMVVKTVVPAQGQVAAFAAGTKLDVVVASELKKLKMAAARYVIPGAAILVAFDVFDGMGAWREGKTGLTIAYIGRFAGGASSIVGIVTSIFWVKAARTILFFNVAGLLFTVATTIAIELLKDKEWQLWLMAQPFRDDTKAGQGAWKTSAHQSLDHMMSKLNDAVVEARKG